MSECYKCSCVNLWHPLIGGDLETLAQIVLMMEHFSRHEFITKKTELEHSSTYLFHGYSDGGYCIMVRSSTCFHIYMTRKVSRGGLQFVGKEGRENVSMKYISSSLPPTTTFWHCMPRNRHCMPRNRSGIHSQQFRVAIGSCYSQMRTLK